VVIETCHINAKLSGIVIQKFRGIVTLQSQLCIQLRIRSQGNSVFASFLFHEM